MNPIKLFVILIFLAKPFLSSSQTESMSFSGGWLQIEYTATAPVCAGQSSGSVFVEVTGGTPPFNFDWEDLIDDDDPQNRTGMFAGSYYLTVTDANVIMTTIEVIVPDPDEIAITAVISHESSLGANDGEINIEVANALPPYYFEWDTDPIEYGEALSNLAPGMYCVNLIDANNCNTEECFYIVDENTLPLIISSSVENTLCEGVPSGSIVIDIELGTPPYTFIWSDLQEGSNIQNREGLVQGIYELTLVDGEGNQLTTSFDINNLLNVNFDLIVNEPSQIGVADGSIYIENLVGQSPYTYDWVDLISGNEGQNRLNIFPGFYCVTVTDFYGCQEVECINLEVESTVSIGELDLLVDSNDLIIKSFAGVMTVEFQSNVQNVIIYNNLGQSIFKKECPKSTIEVFATPGIYIILYELDNKLTTKKIYIH